jgi:hypothetical protein
MSDVCSRLHGLVASAPRLSFPFDPKRIPMDGIYVLFEKAEPGHGTDRIVRVGTHTGAKQLPSRLRQHFILENKDRSIFRKNIGRALLHRDHDLFIKHWELDLTTTAARAHYAGTIDTEKRRLVERRVTEYMQNSFTFTVIGVDEKDERLELESKLISTVSLCTDCGPSPNWLGRHSPKQQVRKGGLWNVNELYKTPLSPSDLSRFEALMRWELPRR